MKKKTFIAASIIALLLFSLAISICPIYAQTPNFSDYMPPPTIPQFTLNFVPQSYSKIETDPNTGLNITQQVDDSIIDVIITNQLFSPYNYSYTFPGSTEPVYGSTSLSYDVQTKVHYAQDWSEFTTLRQSRTSFYTVISVPAAPILYPAGSQIDFRVEAIVEGDYFVWGQGRVQGMERFTKDSGWSNTQTITIPANSSSPAPTPSPSLSTTPALNPTSSLSPISTSSSPIPSPPATQEPTITISPTPIVNHDSGWIPYAIIAVAVALGVSALVYFKKRKK